MTITRILVPTDFSADADAALTYALGLAQRFGASIDVLHVVEDPLAAGVWSSEVYTADVDGLLDQSRSRRRAAPRGTTPPATVDRSQPRFEPGLRRAQFWTSHESAPSTSL